jgi:hypothetical protein
VSIFKKDEDKVLDKGITDISLASYLVTKSFKMTRYEKEAKMTTFYFQVNKELDDEILKFFNHDATIDPLRFSESLRNLKTLTKIND